MQSVCFVNLRPEMPFNRKRSNLVWCHLWVLCQKGGWRKSRWFAKIWLHRQQIQGL
jgi:hypothetical protein